MKDYVRPLIDVKKSYAAETFADVSMNIEDIQNDGDYTPRY